MDALLVILSTIVFIILCKLFGIFSDDDYIHPW